MAFLIELLFRILGELLLQVVFEVLAELGVHYAAEAFKQRPNPWLAAIGYAIIGAIAGVLSLLAFPAMLISSHTGRIASLVITPVLAGAAMSLLGAWRQRRGQAAVRLNRFAYGYLFALAMALVRFGVAH